MVSRFWICTLIFVFSLIVSSFSWKESVLSLDNSNFYETVGKHDFIVVHFYVPWFVVLWPFCRLLVVLGASSDNRSRDIKEKVLLVKPAFLIPWCGFNNKFASEYEKAATVLSGYDARITLAKVDVNEEKSEGLASEFKISSYPTIKILRYGGNHAQDYLGPRDADGIVAYLIKQRAPPPDELKSTEDLYSDMLWTLEPAKRDAVLANEVTKRWTSSNQVLVEIACARSPHELLLAKQAYHARFKKSLEEDVAHHTTGDFRKLLVPLVSTYRYNGDEVNMTLAKSEAKILHENISKEHYSNEDLITILATRSKAQVNATLNQYKNEFGHDILEDLEADPNDECLSILRATVKCLTWPEKYFEKVLQLAINKRGKVGSNGCDRIWCCGGEVLLKNLPLKKKLAKFGFVRRAAKARLPPAGEAE
ncbi:unnamed protein product [Camellia sinensis]